MAQEQSLKNEDVKKANSQYEQDFEFVLSSIEKNKTNESGEPFSNIICQRYFKINGFNQEALNSEELEDTLRDCVEMIKKDLVSKSRIYMWYTVKRPLKLTGFGNRYGCDEDGRIFVEKKTNDTYLYYNEDESIDGDEAAKLEPYDIMFQFEFKYRKRTYFKEIWDATMYPKYIRNGVDLSNSGNVPQDAGEFIRGLVRNLVLSNETTEDGKPRRRKDLNYEIIMSICDATSGEGKTFTHTKDFGSVEYNTSDKYYSRNKNAENGECKYFKEYIDGWREYTEKKTKKYYRNMY